MNFIPIIKVVSINCNLKCDYCFYYNQEQNNNQLMNAEVLESLISETCKHNLDKAEFIWHGGEPLLAGIDFFRMVIEFQAVLEAVIREPKYRKILKRKARQFSEKAEHFERYVDDIVQLYEEVLDCR